jgi:hypothetical protein
MKRIAQLAVVAALSCGAQAAWSDEASSQAPVAATESAETYLNVAQMAGSAERNEAPQAQRAQAAKPRNMLVELGLSHGDGFPQQGGPIDD